MKKKNYILKFFYNKFNDKMKETNQKGKEKIICDKMISKA